MAGTKDQKTKLFQPKSRVMGRTEHSWCRAVTCGTGVTVLGLQMTKPPFGISVLHNVLAKLQSSHPLLGSKLHYDTSTKQFSFLNTDVAPPVKINSFDPSSTLELLKKLSDKGNSNNLSPFHLLLEHELNSNKWSDPSSFPSNGIDVMFASVYTLPDAKCVIVLRFHTVICDRTTAVSLLRELMELAKDGDGGKDEVQKGIEIDTEGNLGIEDLIPSGLAKKTFWVHGMDMLGYSVNSLRLTNLKFKNVKWPRCSEVVRLQMNTQDTDRILVGCKSRGIKLCGALAAAGLIAAHSSKSNSDQTKKKYGVVTLTDCRSILEPPLSSHQFGKKPRFTA
ncbi:Hypothetical predicted protein [Olea europaea subsp. europaea]|uniref:Uncharacterized protein n=1 Tax=Olea europaea subsp. europaea TaxID=158383 RepID=A0A8S0QWL0_OLEEU|nr:Hypothetical predicted protein [Olea europaea subsp. europaea]